MSKPVDTTEDFARGLDAFQAFHRAHGLRFTPAKREILRAVLRIHEPFDARMVAKRLRVRNSKISLPSVYRTLPLMVEARVVRKTSFSPDDRQLYEVTFGRPAFDRLTCQSCRAVVEFDSEEFAVHRQSIAGRYSFVLESHLHEVVGVCAGCRARNR
ncbi:MAG: transcriptional repressor [Polyangiaceae bacterium]